MFEEVNVGKKSAQLNIYPINGFHLDNFNINEGLFLRIKSVFFVQEPGFQRNSKPYKSRFIRKGRFSHHLQALQPGKFLLLLF